MKKKKYNLEEVKSFLYENYSYYQVFNSRNTVGDCVETVYCKDGVTIDACYNCWYVEVFGLDEEDFESIEYRTHLRIPDIRHKLSALLMDSSEETPVSVNIVMDYAEGFGLSDLEMPHCIKVFQQPDEGIMWMLFEGAEDYVEIEEDDYESMWFIYDYLLNK